MYSALRCTSPAPGVRVVDSRVRIRGAEVRIVGADGFVDGTSCSVNGTISVDYSAPMTYVRDVWPPMTWMSAWLVVISE